MTALTGSPPDLGALALQIKDWGRELGFQQVGVTDTDLRVHERRLSEWLAAGWHGEMGYMARHGIKRSRPADLVPGTQRVISVRMDYLPESNQSISAQLDDPTAAFISRYALGRDYHKVLRRRLAALTERIARVAGPNGYRVFVDSAPVLERALAEKAGLGWIGKHTNLINRNAGSWFFLGEIFTDLPLPLDTAVESHCGRCTACIDVCPTRAIVAPYRLDARRCISYLTIELRGPIPLEFRPMIGNRIYGCDDCQLVCPWNRFARLSQEADFMPRHGLDVASLIDVFKWDEATFLRRTEGSAIRRIGYARWLRNIAVALGNAPRSSHVAAALQTRKSDSEPLVVEHTLWALRRQQGLPGLDAAR